MNPELIVAAIAALFVAVFFYGFVPAPEDPIVGLRARYFALARLPRAEGARELDRRVERLTVKYPGKTYSWYLRWLVRDLERAKDVR